MSSRWRRARLLIVLFAGLAWLMPAQAEDQVVIEIPVIDLQAPAQLQTVRVHQENEVVLRWTSNAPVELHLHGYDLTAEVRPGAAAEMRFLASATGRFAVEAHTAAGHRRIVYIEVHPR